jgi:carboxylate-amine ligase
MADDNELTSIGVEEEFHVVDLESRASVAHGPSLLRQLPDGPYTAELHPGTVEVNLPQCTTLGALRDQLVRSRGQLITVAGAMRLGIVAAGTVPLIDHRGPDVSPSARYERILSDYQLLAREQIICGAHVHVQVSDRDLAVAIAHRVGPHLPVLLALSASSPFWMGEDSGYASVRSVLWRRWPTTGWDSDVASAAEHDALVADLLASGTIIDAGMVYFDIRPSAHLPTLELRVADACPDLDDVVMIAGLFRALVRREAEQERAGVPHWHRPSSLTRVATWRAARSGLEGPLLDLPRSPRPVPAADAVRRLLTDLRPQLEAVGDWETVSQLVEQALIRGSSAARQRAVHESRGRLTDVVDDLLKATQPS